MSVTPTPSVAALQVRGVSKTYGNVQALRGVDLTVRRGTVHGLVGENGSGKSTLTKIIAGVVAPDAGEISVEDEPITEFDPRESLGRGLRVIYQDLALFANLSIAENLTFAGDTPLHRRIHWRERRARATDALAELGMQLDPATRVADLPAAERQLVAIARAVSSDGRIILMDEPTAALTHDEIERLLDTIRNLSDRGLSFVFISHKLREVVAVADDVTVLRNGAVVASDRAEAFDQERISYLMTGGHIEQRAPTERTGEFSDAPPLLEAKGLTLPSVFSDVDLTVHPGQVVGLAGVVGSGRTEIGLAVSGLISPSQGTLRFRGREVTSTRGIRELQYVPEDRLTEGLFLEWSVAENIIVNSLNDTIGRSRLIDRSRIHSIGETWRQRLALKAPSVATKVSTLSGGNQQRVLLARALACKPAVVVLNNPTVGVDVGSRAEIHQRIRTVAEEGAGLLIISDEPSELISVCDQILVVRQGKITDRVYPQGLSEGALWDLIAREDTQV